MQENSTKYVLDDDAENSRRAFFKRAGSLLLATGTASLGALGMGNVALGAGMDSDVQHMSAKALPWHSWENLGGVLT